MINYEKLVSQVEAILADAGDPEVKDFDATAWLEEWLQTPAPALGGVVPASIVESAEGFKLVSGMIKKIHAGVFA